MTQTSEFRGVARAIHTDSHGDTHFVYHKTAVVTRHKDGRITLRSGGWKTNTTRTAMNQASNQCGLGFRVGQKDFDWFVTWRGQKVPFVDGMVLS